MQQNRDLGACKPFYFYCSRSTSEPERSRAEGLIRSLVRQIASSGPDDEIPESVKDRYDRRTQQGEPTAKEWTEILRDLLDTRAITYIFVDALDECAAAERGILHNLFDGAIRDSKDTSLLKVFISSRDEQDIVARATDYTSISIQPVDNQSDIELYIRHQIDQLISEKSLLRGKVNGDLKQQIIKRLCDGAQGMFIWARFSLKHLCTMKTRSGLVEKLGTLPQDLNSLYEDLYQYNQSSLPILRRLHMQTGMHLRQIDYFSQYS